MRLVLIADLHFGTVEPSLVPRLLSSIADAAPDLVVIAGDFVQRARASHFRYARDFLDQLQDELDAPWIAVPGNHDIPLYNLPERIFAPRRAFRKWITPETEPLHDHPDARIIGVDTTDPHAHQRGRIDAAQCRRVGALIRDAGDRLPVVLAHHPFHHRESVEKKLMRGAPRALDAWAECGPHVILSGHLHTYLVEPFVARKGDGQTLQVHCGTSASSRLRGEENDFAILDIEDRRVRVTRMTYSQAHGFDRDHERGYAIGEVGWQPV